MTDMQKEIVFRDGWTLDGLPFDEFLKARACDIIELGYYYGLKLDEFYCDTETVYFTWRGTKRSMLDWYSRYGANDPEERKQATIQIILNK